MVTWELILYRDHQHFKGAIVGPFGLFACATILLEHLLSFSHDNLITAVAEQQISAPPISRYPLEFN
jgi:hypothetical protein